MFCVDSLCYAKFVKLFCHRIVYVTTDIIQTKLTILINVSLENETKLTVGIFSKQTD